MTNPASNHALIGFFAETFIHAGCGQSQGAIDLPFSREAATEYPFVPGSSLKGALRDYARENLKDKEAALFGQSENAGELLVSDLRLLLLPVRSLTSHYKYVTCPHILQRFSRDLQRVGLAKSSLFDIKVTHQQIGEVEDDNQMDKTLFLEELSFKKNNDNSDNSGLIRILQKLSDSLGANEDEVENKLVIVSDDDFHYFAKYALAIQTRNVLDDDTKESKNLWHEESLPPDTLMYALLSNRNRNRTRNDNASNDDNALNIIVKKIADKYIQIGGNETVGMGWFQMKKYEKDNG